MKAAVLVLGSLLLGSASGTAHAEEGDVVVSCASWGAELAVIEGAPHSGRFSAVIGGTAAEYIIGEEGMPVIAIGGGYDQGRTWETRKALPMTFKVTDRDGEPVVLIENLFKYDIGFLSGQYHPGLREESGGVKLTIPYFKMTGSHSTMQYEYANWFFENCSF